EIIKEYWQKYGYLIWILLALAAVTVAVIYLLGKYKKNEPILFVPHKPILSPQQQALKKLKELKAKKLWQQNLIKEYYTELTDIFRSYLETEYHIPAVEMTSYELSCELLRKYPNHQKEMEELSIVLQTSDLVKFAKNLPLANEHENCFAKILHFIEQEPPMIVQTLPTNKDLSETPAKPVSNQPENHPTKA
ncbi:MAG: hypothetical protein RSA02_05645, partial [Bacteroidales bacterium]